MHVTDFSKLPQNIVIDLINEDNGKNITLDQVSVGVPVAGVGKSTSIVATAKLGSGYRGDQTFIYDRVELSEVEELDTEGKRIVADVVSGLEILALFNTKFGLNVTADDVLIDDKEPSESYVQPDANTEVVISAKPGSLVWFGECIIGLRPTNPFMGLPEGTTVASADGAGVVRVAKPGVVRVYATPANPG